MDRDRCVPGEGRGCCVQDVARCPPVRCEGQCVVALPEGPGECVASAPGSGYRPEGFPLPTLRALPRDGKGPPAQPVNLKYIRL